MKDQNGIEVIQFKDLEIGRSFKIPSFLDHEMEVFTKLYLNKAKSHHNNRIEHFVDKASVWTIE